MTMRAIAIIAALVATFPFAAALAQNAAPRGRPNPVPPVPPVATDTTTSLVCYFKKGEGENEDTTWQWGLNPDDKSFVLSGQWRTTPKTQLQKFFTDTLKGPMDAACDRAKTYYELDDYQLFAYFAANNVLNYNYPIVACGVELFPDY